MLHDLTPAAALLCHGIGSILAHSHSVAVSRYRKGEHSVGFLYRKTGRAQAKQGKVQVLFSKLSTNTFKFFDNFSIYIINFFIA